MLRAWGQKLKGFKLFQWIKDNGYDICFIQEAHFTNNDKTQWEKELGGDAFFSGESSSKEGICILIKPELVTK